MESAVWKDAAVASAYLNQRSIFIPNRDKQLEVMLRVMRYAPAQPRRVLDLGCGDGVLLDVILRAYPQASGIALDFSPRMLDQARSRLAPLGDRAQIAEADLAAPGWQQVVTGSFDAVVSGLAIHHLPHARKRQLYQEIFKLLTKGGIFLNIEHVCSPTLLLEKISEDLMVEYLTECRRQQGEDVSIEQIRMEYLERPDRAANVLAPVHEQCEWLTATGFQHVDCFWKCFELAVFGGMRTAKHPGGTP